MELDVFTSRSEVCERKVTGTRTVTKTRVVVPAVTEEYEDIEEVTEWECPPSILGADVQ
jgi:hypothetical protein